MFETIFKKKTHSHFTLSNTEQLCHQKISLSETSTWSSLLLVVPLRLGLLNINPIYIDSLKVIFYNSSVNDAIDAKVFV